MGRQSVVRSLRPGKELLMELAQITVPEGSCVLLVKGRESARGRLISDKAQLAALSARYLARTLTWVRLASLMSLRVLRKATVAAKVITISSTSMAAVV